MALAEAASNPSAYAQAALNKAKLLGHLTERAEIKQMTVSTPSDLRPDLAKLWIDSGLPELSEGGKKAPKPEVAPKPELEPETFAEVPEPPSALKPSIATTH